LQTREVVCAHECLPALRVVCETGYREVRCLRGHAEAAAPEPLLERDEGRFTFGRGDEKDARRHGAAGVDPSSGRDDELASAGRIVVRDESAPRRDELAPAPARRRGDEKNAGRHGTRFHPTSTRRNELVSAARARRGGNEENAGRHGARFHPAPARRVAWS
jgi:hypothetical protein